MQRHSVTSLETALSLVGGGGGVGLREKHVFCVPAGIAASPVSLLSMGGVCGRSLTVGKILFTGMQIWSLYLVIWLCGASSMLAVSGRGVLRCWSQFSFLLRTTGADNCEKSCSVTHHLLHRLVWYWSWIMPQSRLNSLLAVYSNMRATHV